MNRQEAKIEDVQPSISISIGVAIITWRAAALLPKCLPPLQASRLRPKILVVNSSSNDGTIELAGEMGAQTLVVPRHQFNHGATRELARRVLGTDIVVMMTPDARPLGADILGNLVRPIADGRASAAYARQVPREGADVFEAFPREFNYPERSELRSLEDVKTSGPQAFFCSNVCAAWSNAALDSIGGFAPTLSLEDVIAASKLLYAGHRIAYCADAVVEHSHAYTLAQEFRRQFDTGYVRAEHRSRLFAEGGDERRGVDYSMKLLRRLVRDRPDAIPYAIANIASRYIGYRTGFHGHRLPLALKRRFSAQDFYWQRTEIPCGTVAESPQPQVTT